MVWPISDGHAHASPISPQPLLMLSQAPGRTKSVEALVSGSRKISPSVIASASSWECTAPTS